MQAFLPWLARRDARYELRMVGEKGKAEEGESISLVRRGPDEIRLAAIHQFSSARS